MPRFSRWLPPGAIDGRWGNLRRQTGEAFEPWPTYYRLNSRGVIRREAAKVGFQEIDLSMVEGHPSYLVFHSLAFLMGVAYERIVNSREAFAGFRSKYIWTACEVDRTNGVRMRLPVPCSLLKYVFRNRIFRRRLPRNHGRWPIWISPDASFGYFKPGNTVFDSELLGYVERYVAPGNVALDIGANVGELALAAANRTQQCGNVLAIAPGPFLASLIL